MAIGRKGKWRHHRRMLAWAGSSLPKCWESYSRSSVARGWENANVLGCLLAPFSVRWTGGDWRETWASRLPVACLELYPRVSMGSCFESESDNADTSNRRNLSDLNPNVACWCGKKGVDVLIDAVTGTSTRNVTIIANREY
jgi:hypothetical protein